MTMTKQRSGRTRWSHLADIDPTEWEYVGAFDSNPGEDDGPQWVEPRTYEALEASAISLWENSGQCDHCGARIRYVVVLRHLPSGDVIAVGETCVSERFDFATKAEQAVHLLRKKAAAASATRATLARRDAYLAENPAAAEALTYLEAHRDGNAFYTSLVKALSKYGEWTERQLAAALAAPERDAERARKQEERDAEVKVPCPEGRIEIVGTVVSVKIHDGYMGDELKMTVKDDRGFLVWGTVPTSLSFDLVDWSGSRRLANGKHDRPRVPDGRRVKFTATVTRSDRDESFGFYKRPAKAELIEEAGR